MVKKEIDYSGTIRYYNEKHGYHRTDGPAVEYTNGYKAWWKNNQKHRLNAPAVISIAQAYKEYWEFGNFIKKEAFK